MKLLTVAAMALACCTGLAAQATSQPAGDPQPLKIGDAAPNFTLGSTKGGKVSLADYHGKQPVVLAFFPAAFTGG